MEVTRIFDLLPYHEITFKPKEDVISSKENGEWVRYGIKQYREIVDNISYGFLVSGVQPGDKIAQISTNRAEWNFVDMAILQVGAIHVPIYPTISESDYKYILGHAEVTYIFVSGMELLRKIQHILPEISHIKGVYTYKEHDGLKHLNELIDLGKKNPNPVLLEQRKSAITEKDVATIIYTSGTTGNPKGVMLTHHNIISNFKACAHIPPFGEEAKAVSYLPLCHVYERMLNYLYHYLGFSIYYAENLGTITENIKDVKPDILSTVPRLLEKIYDKLFATGHKLTGVKRWIFFWALHLALRYELKGANGWFYELKRKLYDQLVYSKWRDALGGKHLLVVSGGAALQPRLARMFTCAGINVLEGYGLTETSPVIAVNELSENGMMFGTVGKVLKGVQVKIAGDGEILCKGPNVMSGYFKAPEMTLDAIEADGWFHTGDLGRIESEGHLKITGRKKELFKTSFGKYVSPQPIEDTFKESLFIDQIIVVGENQKFAGALIVPDFTFLQSWCNVKEISYTTNTEMVQLPRIRKRFQTEINRFNKLFGDTEKIKSWDLLEEEWSFESGEITPTLKLKRNFILGKYKNRIEKLFA
ncbi:MAG: long-chain fatty acid--CoA ligase [Bacteroidales bacterium]|jgi:long-chain acyl-CoA synthetase|nr:long-chain fatty acid--CoA ligase [Bacteroidales bacterium]